jgi:O-methyltransferase involved in polyketide biosynthesis
MSNDPEVTGPTGQDLAAEIDTTVPHSARVWNYWLGGIDNFTADRAAGDEFIATFPGIVDVARASRAFLGRAVRYLAGEAGVEQFLDVGSGLPTAENTHEIAQRVTAGARVVYVDKDPVVLAHSRTLLAGTTPGTVAYVSADLHDPAGILARAGHTLDLSRPVGLILNGVLGHVADTDQAHAVVAGLLAGLCPGSYLVLSDGTPVVDAAGQQAQDDYNSSGAEAYHLRTPTELAEFFAGLELVDPGLVSITLWRPARDAAEPAELDNFGAVAHKP